MRILDLTFAHEKLVEQEGLRLSVTSTRNLMIDRGIWIPKKSKKKRVFQMRQRIFTNMTLKATSQKQNGTNLNLKIKRNGSRKMTGALWRLKIFALYIHNLIKIARFMNY